MHKYEITNVEGGTAFLVQVRPEANKNEITGKDDDVVYIDLAVARELKEIDQNLCIFLAEKLMIDVNNVSIASGNSMEKKIVIIMGLTPEDIESRLLV